MENIYVANGKKEKEKKKSHVTTVTENWDSLMLQNKVESLKVRTEIKNSNWDKEEAGIARSENLKLWTRKRKIRIRMCGGKWVVLVSLLCVQFAHMASCDWWRGNDESPFH